MSAVDNPILTIDGLSVKLPKGADRSHALGGVSMAISANEIVCVVGESGSGKSVMANAIMRLLPGEVADRWRPRAVRGQGSRQRVSNAEMRKVRGAGIAMIFQEPMTALNPLRTIGDQIGEMFEIHTESLEGRHQGARAGAAAGRAHSRSCAGRTRLSARTLRRPAPARHDRHGAGARSASPDRRRADHRARRHHTGADPEADQGIAEPQEYRGAVHHPRFWRGRRDRRQGRGDAARQGGRTGRGQGRADQSAASLYAAADRRGATADGAAAAHCPTTSS